MIHPEQVIEMLKPTGTATATWVPGPVPTTIPIPAPTEYQVAGSGGHRALWVVFAIMVASSGVFALSSWNVPISRRVYYVITTLMSIIASLSYFAMASGHASTFVCNSVRNHGDGAYHDVCRQVYWARYVDWALTMPLLVLDLSLLAGIDGGHTLMAVTANVIMVLTGMFSAFGAPHTAQKWGWFTISCISYVFVFWHVALHGTRMVAAKGAGVRKLFSSLGLFVFLLWTAYPIVWGVAAGAKKVSVDTEIMTYAVLDTLAKTVFGLWLLMAHRGLAETNIDLDGYWSHGLAADGRIRVGDEE